MTDDFKKWLCELAGIEYNYFFESFPDKNKAWGGFELIILVKAMWAINRAYSRREGEYCIKDNTHFRNITPCFSIVHDYIDLEENSIYLQDHNNSEQEALTAALEYIYEQNNNKKT